MQELVTLLAAGLAEDLETSDSRRRIDLAAAAVMAHDRARALASGPRAAIYVLG